MLEESPSRETELRDFLEELLARLRVFLAGMKAASVYAAKTLSRLAAPPVGSYRKKIATFCQRSTANAFCAVDHRVIIGVDCRAEFQRRGVAMPVINMSIKASTM